MADPVRVISAEDLKEKLDGGDDFRLVNALGEWEFKAKRTPRSKHFASVEELVDRGYENVRRFEGGLLGWEDAGYPFEGDNL